MKTSKPSVRNILLAAAVALPLFGMTGAARADEMKGGPDDSRPPLAQGGPQGGPPDGPQGSPGSRGPERGGPEQGGPGRRGPGPEHGPGFGPGGFGPGGFAGGRPPLFRGVELTDAQEDKVFAILHAEAPYLREQAKAAAKAQEALRALAGADKYDDAKAASLAQAAATANANIALQHVRTRQKLLAVLSPEQRKKLDEDKPRRPPRP